ncbi:MAG: hypothetical protein V9G19_06455 [Tetrasphaera sp.]
MRSYDVCFVEPEEEPHGFGDLLFGSVHRSSCRCASGRFRADALQVMPGGEVPHRLADLFGQTCELGIDPLLEARQVFVAVGEETMVLHDRPQVLGRFAGHRVESFVGDGDRAVGEGAEKVLDFRGSLPDKE